MIVSHKHKFIFLKTNKTAGTSVEIALSKWCGPDDIITPISPEDEVTRAAFGGRAPQNFQKRWWQLRSEDYAQYKARGAIPPRFYAHIPAQQAKDLIPAKVWNSYFKFCVERNPWDRLVSVYYWRNKQEPRPTISEFIARGEHLVLKQKGADVYCIDGKPVVDQIIKYEEMSTGLEAVRQRLGLPEPLELPKAKSGYRADRRHYRDLLADADRDRIAQDFGWEIDQFGYNF